MPSLDQLRTLSGHAAEHAPSGATAIAAVVSQHWVYILAVPLLMVLKAAASDIVRIMRALITDGIVQRIEINNAKQAKALRAEPEPGSLLRHRRHSDSSAISPGAKRAPT
jgi:hypothetical protein